MGWNRKAGGDVATVRCLVCNKYLPNRRTGTGKRYLITDPNGNTYTPESLVEFCKEHDLTPQNLRKVAKGTRKHHKGWKAVEIS